MADDHAPTHGDHGHAAAAHVHGTMDIAEQTRTFDGFLKGAAIVLAVSVAILLLLTFRI